MTFRGVASENAKTAKSDTLITNGRKRGAVETEADMAPKREKRVSAARIVIHHLACRA
jgi:hypothetical protein